MPSRSTDVMPADIDADESFTWPPLKMPSAVAENSRAHRAGGSKPQGNSKLQDDLKLLDDLHQSRAAPEPAPSRKSNPTSTWTQMMDAFQSDPRRDAVTSSRQLNTRLFAGAVAALLIVAGAFVWRITASSPPAQVASVVSPAAPAKNPVLDELVETTRALEASQQQAVDQLQVLQQLLTSQQAEARKSSGQVAALNAKLETLQQSFASIPAVPAEEEAAPPRRNAKPAAARSRGKAHRVASSSHKTRVASKRH